MLLAAPVTKMSRRFLPHEVPLAPVTVPPSDSRSHPVAYHTCPSGAPEPFDGMNRSTRPGAHDVAAGPDAHEPPISLAQECHPAPAHHECQRAPSPPMVKRSIRLDPHEDAAGLNVP